jgi:LysR family hydrogen peroxide-inducible transcriptional activator
MNIRDLKYLIELAKHKNFAKAANSAFVSQPALSMQIKKLEDELGVVIFERDNKNFLITKIGAEIIKKAEIILQQEKEIKLIAKNSINPESGEIRIGAFPTLASYFFPTAIKKISKKFPQLKIYLIEEKTEILIEKLQNGEIDCAFLAHPIAENSAFEHKKIFSEDFLLAVNKKNSLAKKKKIKASDLKGKNLMLLEDGHCLRGQALEACSLFGAFENRDFRASSLETLRQMVALDNGITLIPQIAALKNSQICYVELDEKIKRTIALYFRKTSIYKNLVLEIAKLF